MYATVLGPPNETHPRRRNDANRAGRVGGPMAPPAPPGLPLPFRATCLSTTCSDEPTLCPTILLYTGFVAPREMKRKDEDPRAANRSHPIIGGAIVLYFVIGLEVLIMISPFAAFFYAAFNPVLLFLARWPATQW